MRPNALARCGRAAAYVLLCAAVALTLAPLAWLVAAAFKGPDDLFSYLFFPPADRLSTQNFHKLLAEVPFARYLANSLFVTGTTVSVQLLFSSMAGFALARYEFRGKALITAMMLLTLMIPAQVTMAPLYELVYRLGLMDSHAGLIVPNALSVFGIFLFRGYFLGLPDEMIQAARLDGCSEFQIYRDFAMPVARPMSGAFCLISFLATWNSFLWPQIILHNSERFTLPIALNQLVGLYKQDYGALMAGTLLSIVPVAALFLLLQKEFVEGLTSGAVKG